MKNDSNWKKFVQWINAVLKDETGNPSSKRVIGVLCGLTLCFALIANGLAGSDFAPSDRLVEAVTALAFGCLGLTAVEKIFEKKNPTPPVNIPTEDPTDPFLE